MAPAHATILAVIGLYRDKAIVKIDGASPRVMRAGESSGEVKLLDADSKRAVFSVGGIRRVLEMGQSFASGPVDAPRPSVALQTDALGHYRGRGTINGYAVEFLIDTGATGVVLDERLAQRLGIDYKKGDRLPVATANGVSTAWKISLSEVSVGPLSENKITAVVVEGPLDEPLLGMSFLNRVDMRRESGQLTLTRRY